HWSNSSPAREIQGTNEQQVTNPNYISWRKTERLVKAWITGTLSEEVLGHAVGTETSQNLWTVLTKAFSQTSEAREFELHSNMQYHLKIDTMSTADYLNADYLNGFKLIFEQLHLIGKPISDQRKVFLLLTNLGPAYDAFFTMMLKLPVPSYADVIPLLQSHEPRKRNFRINIVNQNMAFFSHKNQKGGGSQGFNSRGRGFTQSMARTSQSTNTNSNDTEKKNDQGGGRGAHTRNNNSKSINKCQICSKTGHEALKC
ncbi:UBN2_2 domain-containing protein, partial [Cephalotus follicularis]